MSGTISANSWVYKIAYSFGRHPTEVHKCMLWWRFLAAIFIFFPLYFIVTILAGAIYLAMMGTLCLLTLTLGNAVAVLFSGWLWIPKVFDYNRLKVGLYPGWYKFKGRRVWPIMIILPALVLYLAIKALTNLHMLQSANRLATRIPSSMTFWVIAFLVGLPLLFLALRAIGRSESWQHLGSSFKDWWDNKACPILKVTDLPAEQADKTEIPTT